MKKTFSIVVLLIFSIFVYAQKDVTQFLGIPVDGTKSEMIKKLKDKGFKTVSWMEDVLTGEFNGREVYLSVITTNNKVSRIALFDTNPSDETNIRIRFNTLVRQFQNNSKYIAAADIDNFIIPEDEDISYEMSVNNKRYEALFYQKHDNQIDTTSVVHDVIKIINSKYPEIELDSLASDNTPKELKTEIVTLICSKIVEIYAKSPVWFLINQSGALYSIGMYYDNEYNRADGSDL